MRKAIDCLYRIFILYEQRNSRNICRSLHQIAKRAVFRGNGFYVECRCIHKSPETTTQQIAITVKYSRGKVESAGDDMSEWLIKTLYSHGISGRGSPNAVVNPLM